MSSSCTKPFPKTSHRLFNNIVEVYHVAVTELSLSWDGSHKSLAERSQSQSQKVKRNCNPGPRAAIQHDVWKESTLRGEKMNIPGRRTTLCSGLQALSSIFRDPR